MSRFCCVLVAFSILWSADLRRVEARGKEELRCRRAASARGEEAAGKRRQYAPDRLIDVLHLTIDVTPDFAARSVAGKTTLRFAPVAAPLRELRLHAVDLAIASMEASAPVSGYQTTAGELVVTFVDPLPPGEEQWVAIAHAAEPRQGLYFRTPEMGYRPEDTHLWTQGEPHEARHWYPSFDYPNERFTSEVICRVPAEMVVLSNGRKVGETIDPQTGLKAVRWLQDTPHVNYLVALVAGKLEKVEDRYREIPLGFYTPASQIEQAESAFRQTADIMGFFEGEIGVPFPWDQYNQVVVDDFLWGGMENTTLTVLADWALHAPETENVDSAHWLVAHELAHQWFGDYVTCKDWSHVWLNEGFATYYENLYEGHLNGPDGLLYEMYGDGRRVRDSEDGRPIVFRDYADADEQFDYRAYPKGGWVLHMLRTQLGEPLYRECIRTYVERHALGSAVTGDLNAVIESLSGRSFDRFFDQWVYHGGLPELEVEYSWNEVDRLARVSVEQVHEVDEEVRLFHLPTKVRFATASGRVDREVVVAERLEEFYFPLDEKPRAVRFDPEYGLLAKVRFDKPKEMLYAQLEDSTDVIGRLLAVEALGEKDDRTTVEKLGAVLNEDGFHGVRIEASRALREIHTAAAFQALVDGLDQPDARVRRQVVGDIAGFYRKECREVLTGVLDEEENPAVLEAAIGGLGRYPGRETRKRLLGYLESKSYRNRLAQAAIGAIRALDEPDYAGPLRKALADREEAFTSRGIEQGLEALAYVSRTQEDRKKVRLFLAGYANHPKEGIRAAGIGALGTLRDPAAISVVASFAGGGEEKDRVQEAAEGALKKLRAAREVPVELQELREEVLRIQEESEELREELEALKKRVDARGGREEEEEEKE